MTKPTKLHYARARKVLDIHFEDGYQASLSAEFLRVHSPSAEVRGHGPGQEELQTGKVAVALTAIRPQGHYAVQFVFDDGHDSGIYTWEYLRYLAENYPTLWQTYLDKLAKAGASRDPDTQVVQFIP